MIDYRLPYLLTTGRLWARYSLKLIDFPQNSFSIRLLFAFATIVIIDI